MATADPRATLAEALGALGETLRHHRDLGLTELSLAGDYLLDPAAALRAQEKALQGCRKCKLCEGRSTVVFGSGNPRAEFVVIGEGPGADEDAQGLPFVGRAGQLLTKMLEARKVELSRDAVFITNAVKCRPPGNRNPEADELAALMDRCRQPSGFRRTPSAASFAATAPATSSFTSPGRKTIDGMNRVS